MKTESATGKKEVSLLFRNRRYVAQRKGGLISNEIGIPVMKEELKKLGCAFESSSVVQARKRNSNRPAVNNQGERKNEVRGGLIRNEIGIPSEGNTNRPERAKEPKMKNLETVLSQVRNRYSKEVMANE